MSKSLAKKNEPRDIQAELDGVVSRAAAKFHGLSDVVADFLSQPENREKIIDDCTNKPSKEAPAYVSAMFKFMEAGIKGNAAKADGKAPLNVLIQNATINLPPQRTILESEIVDVDLEPVEGEDDK